MKSFYFFFLFISVTKCFSQLGAQDIKYLEKHALEMMSYLDDSFRKLSASNDVKSKEGFIQNLLKDFTPKARIEVINRSGKRSYTIENYLRNILNKTYRFKYKLVNIEFVKLNLGDFQPHPTKAGVYIIEGCFHQIFSVLRKTTKYSKEEPLKMEPIDITKKCFEIEVASKMTSNGKTWVVRIQDIKVKSVKFY